MKGLATLVPLRCVSGYWELTVENHTLCDVFLHNSLFYTIPSETHWKALQEKVPGIYTYIYSTYNLSFLNKYILTGFIGKLSSCNYKQLQLKSWLLRTFLSARAQYSGRNANLRARDHFHRVWLLDARIKAGEGVSLPSSWHMNRSSELGCCSCLKKQKKTKCLL